MAPVEETRQRAARLRAQARDARSQARDVTEQVRLVAETAAGIEDTIAATFEQLARDRPDREGPLRATSEAARRCAARERKRATREWRREPRPRAGGGNPPAAQTPGPGPVGMPKG
ncbi:MAG: hypothetical protein J2P28_13930, partial [Actinobacteria bacterium]|nr:hypothetical protein [Actinomycetota bacterium]